MEIWFHDLRWRAAKWPASQDVVAPKAEAMAIVHGIFLIPYTYVPSVENRPFVRNCLDCNPSLRKYSRSPVYAFTTHDDVYTRIPPNHPWRADSDLEKLWSLFVTSHLCPLFASPPTVMSPAQYRAHWMATLPLFLRAFDDDRVDRASAAALEFDPGQVDSDPQVLALPDLAPG